MQQRLEGFSRIFEKVFLHSQHRVFDAQDQAQGGVDLIEGMTQATSFPGRGLLAKQVDAAIAQRGQRPFGLVHRLEGLDGRDGRPCSMAVRASSHFCRRWAWVTVDSSRD